MTEEQLEALKEYIHTVAAFKIERRLNGPLPAGSWTMEQFEKRFDEIMLKSDDGGENASDS